MIDKQTWEELNASLMTMSEQQVLETLKAECRNDKRASWVLRIHSRYNVLRAKREREELLRGNVTILGGE